MSLTHFRPLTLLACLTVLACDQGETPIGGFDDDGCAASDEGGDDPQPLVVDCSFYYAGEQQAVRFEPLTDAAGEPTAVELSETLHISGALFDSEFEGRSFQITVFDPAGGTLSSTLYQTGPGRPRNEFWGDHGFTGLNKVTDPGNPDDGLQYACHASDPADPIHEWED